MRIVVHDYSGHPFQVQLSRELARLGHHVLHIYFESFQTPKGGVRRRADDPPLFEIEGLRFDDESFSKYSRFMHRRNQEIRYGKMAARRIAHFRPDAILSSNAPLDTQKIIQGEARRLGAGFIFWLQDIYSAGIETFLRRRKFPLAAPVAAWYRNLEKRMLRSSDAVVIVSADFGPALQQWGVDAERLHVIANWAPFDELRPCPQDSPWSRSHNLAGKFVFLYSGTIGLKHDPRLLLDLAASMRDDPEIAIVVISEGVNADWLRREAAARALPNLKLLALQPWELMPEVLSTASVLMALLDEEAGAFSVPSKVLSYLCVGRPLLLSVAARNVAARIVRQNACGLVAPPGDSASFVTAANNLRSDSELRQRCSANAFAYARRTFDIDTIGQRFDGILHSLEPARNAFSVREAMRRFLPTRIKAHRIRQGPLAGRAIYTSWHDYPGAIRGTTEAPLLAWFARHVKPGETWLDVGAHYGYTSIALAELVGENGRVIAFEPVAATAGCIGRTRELNHLRQLQVVPIGLSAEPGIRPYRLPVFRGMADSTLAARNPGSPIFLSSFDHLWESLCENNPRVDGVKIDVQGMESKVLLGMTGALRQFHPKLVVEFHRGVERGPILDLLASCEYSRAPEAIEPGTRGIADDKSYIFVPACIQRVGPAALSSGFPRAEQTS